jgi:pimeloyl-ACP methyl ester carboxylesterase
MYKVRFSARTCIWNIVAATPCIWPDKPTSFVLVTGNFELCSCPFLGVFCDVMMKKSVVFFHGGGSREDYDADEKLVASLKIKLGPDYLVHYPFLQDDGSPDLGRRGQISHEILASQEGVLLVGHSLGASMLLACLSEREIKKKIGGIFLLATPFWSGTEDWVEAFKLKPDFATRIYTKIPLFFYHCKDDEVVPFDHLAVYKQELPRARFCEILSGGHQLGNDLTLVGNDIRAL